MRCSPEKAAANRLNGAKSTGPRTEAGKAISRGNAIKHGLTGAGMALPDEDAAEIEATFAQHHREMNPQTQAGVAMVFTVALSTLRLTRFGLAEAAISSQRVLDAGPQFEDAQVARRDEAKAKLYKDPVAQLAVLSRFQVGARWVIDAWTALGYALSSEQIKNWRQPQFDLFEALMGHSTEFPNYDDSKFWNLAAMGDPTALDDREMFTGNSPAARCQNARDKILEVVDREIEKWEAILVTATASTAVARANAIKAARYDGSKEGLLAKKYEAATRRELHKALKNFALVEAEFAEAEPIAESSMPVDGCVAVGSFLPGPEPEPDLPSTEVAGSESVTTRMAHSSQTPNSDRSPSAPAPDFAPEAGETRLL